MDSRALSLETESPNWANSISRLSTKSGTLDCRRCSTEIMPPIWMGYCSPTSSAETFAEATPVSEVEKRIPGVNLAAIAVFPSAASNFV